MKKIMTIIAVLMASCNPANLEVEDKRSGFIEEEPSPITWTECGYDPGDNPCNFELINQDGNIVSLYDLFGKPIIIDFSTMWCYYCQVAASEIDQVATAYEDRDLVYMTILAQDFQGQPADQADLEEWSLHFGIGNVNTPVLAGDMNMVDPLGESGWRVEAWPTFYFIDREMVIAEYMRGWNSTSVNALIDQISQ